MDSVMRELMNEKRDELILELTEKGFTTKQLSVIFNKHFSDIEKVLEKYELKLLIK